MDRADVDANAEATPLVEPDHSPRRNVKPPRTRVVYETDNDVRHQMADTRSSVRTGYGLALPGGCAHGDATVS